MFFAAIGSVLATEGKCFGSDGNRFEPDGKCFRLEGKCFGLEGKRSAAKEAFRLRNGGVMAPDATFREMRLVSRFA